MYINPNLPVYLSPSPSVSIHLFSMSTSLFLLANNTIYTIFFLSPMVVLVVKNPHFNAGGVRDVGSIPGLGRSPGEGNGNPLQYSCLDNPMDRGVWQATVHGVARVGPDLATELRKAWGFPHSSVGKEYACNAGDPSSIPGLERATREGKKLITLVIWPRQLVHGVAKSQTGLSNFHFA